MKKKKTRLVAFEDSRNGNYEFRYFSWRCRKCSKIYQILYNRRTGNDQGICGELFLLEILKRKAQEP